MELKFIDYLYNDKKLNFDIKPATIYGITGQGKDEILDIISLNSLNKGQLIINNIKVTKDNLGKYQKQISYIGNTIKTHQQKILNIMNNYIKRHNLVIKEPNKKIKDSLRIVGLQEEILERNMITLSNSEKKLLQLAISLLSNPEIIIIDEIFKFLDKQHEKQVIILLQRLKEQFKKTIIISSSDSNRLYQYTTEMLFIKNNEILLSGKTNELYLRVDYLKKNRFEIPDIVEFTYIAKKKKEVKIDYHKDVRDIIKDIYKHI